MLVSVILYYAIKDYCLSLLSNKLPNIAHTVLYYLSLIAVCFCFVGVGHLARSVVSLVCLRPLICSGFGWILTLPMYFGRYLIEVVTNYTLNLIMGNYTSLFYTRPTVSQTGGLWRWLFLSLCDNFVTNFP